MEAGAQPSEVRQTQQVQKVPELVDPAPLAPYGYEPGVVYYDPYYGIYRQRHGYSYQSASDGVWFCLGTSLFVVLFWILMIAIVQEGGDFDFR
jgi:hypothetical protein